MEIIRVKLVLIFLMSILQMQAQIPLNDATWQLVHQDNFNSSTLSQQWITTYPWGSPVNNGFEYNSASNLSLNYNSGYLSIKCETVTPITYTPGFNSPYSYQSGVISSTWTAKYGYIEISAKMPIGYGFWPAFWVYSQQGSTPPSCWYNEIDISENGGAQNNSADEMGYNYHWFDANCIRDALDPQAITGLPNTANEHKYAVFWEPNSMTWFFDDKPVRRVYDVSFTPTHSLTVLINFALQWPPSGTLPAYFEINDFKLWQLNSDCNNAVNFCGNFNASNYISKVKQAITIGGSGCVDIIYTSDNVNFWATDYVLLNEGTTISDNGTGGFSMNVTGCPN